ncbi:GL20396 [Drosophila persimilis]|uniref:GL20396 n=1 Tax=Drosophila persimilis TaxID=7234 RepID=B4GY19_DROPE|nr:GL20396 [Drosophila persimilis]
MVRRGSDGCLVQQFPGSCLRGRGSSGSVGVDAFVGQGGGRRWYLERLAAAWRLSLLGPGCLLEGRPGFLFLRWWNRVGESRQRKPSLNSATSDSKATRSANAMNAAPEDHVGINEIVDLTEDTDSEGSDVDTDTESGTSSGNSTDDGEEYTTDSEEETRRYDPPPPYSRHCPPGSITLQGGPSELPSYQRALRGTRPADLDPFVFPHGPINTDEDSHDEDTSRHGTTTPNEDPNAD